ncbi:uncharacterized protein LY89DRAFT_783085 [Mollisia scopiformis]|uniref:BTB domain-containing protein n=1 Tax=Mollisia scopiformis TaxID=149040 RepID=A0A194X6K2_MOLSC|nr:uncharacterized protein LY89DRAFT_783085 [Mollisia scopiformis]KUJ15816.1 hypothetical protein LY89DRAFT_783085 [Mollisia scopiformis]
MAPEKQIFDPDGDLTFILPSSSSTTTPDTTSSTTRGSSRKHKAPTKEEHVHMQVSSKHMMLASPVFKAMLTNSFQEGNALREAGKVDIPLPDDDPVVFTIILDIIHNRGRRVPKVVPLKLLALLSAVVDKYQIQEPVAVFSDSWIKEATEEMSAKRPDELMMWLSIAWVFRHDEKFEEVTGILLRNSTPAFFKNLDEGIPIPHTVLDAIQCRRVETLQAIYKVLEYFINLLEKSSPKSVCASARGQVFERDCDAMLLGCLLKACTEASIWPAPEPPYEGHSIRSLQMHMEPLKLRSLCDYINVQGPDLTPATSGYGHYAASAIRLRVKGVVQNLKDFTLEDFLP